MRALYVVFFLLSSLPGAAQSPDQAFAIAFNAHGGAPGILAVQTIRIHGQSVMKSGTSPITITASLEGKVRIDYGSPVFLSRITTADGRIEIDKGKVVHKPPHAGAFAELDWLSVLGIRHLASGIDLRTQGLSSILGRVTLRISVATGRQQTHYDREVRDEADVQLDAETGLVAAIVRKQYASRSLDHSFILTTAFSEYRPVSGIVLPHRIGRYLDGRLRETITVDSIEINPILLPDFFQR